MEEKVKILNTKGKGKGETNGLISSPQVSPHKNPNEYNGEVLGNQKDTTKNSNSKQVYIDVMVRYNYLIDSEIENNLDSITYNRYDENPLKYHSIDKDIDSFDDVYEKLKMINQNEYLDHEQKLN